MLGPAKYTIRKPDHTETTKNFRLRLANAGAEDKFKARLHELKVSMPGTASIDRWRKAADEFGYTKHEIKEEHWSPEAMRARRLNGVGLLGLSAHAPSTANAKPKSVKGEDAVGRDGFNAWQRLAMIAKGRKSSPTADAMWAYENANVPVEMIDVNKIPSAGAITLLRMAHDEPDKFIAQVVAKLVLKGAEREMDEKSAFKREDMLLDKAKRWAEETSMNVISDALMESGELDA